MPHPAHAERNAPTGLDIRPLGGGAGAEVWAFGITIPEAFEVLCARARGKSVFLMALDGVFWTAPSEDDSKPTDPLGLDAMREELAGRLVPCLTGRTRRHEDFFWSLVFLRWAETEANTEQGRVQRFLHWERCLKLYWVHDGRGGFAGVRRAKQQANEPGAPWGEFRPLLKNQRDLGLLGAHLAPLRKLELAEEDSLRLTAAGTRLAEAAGRPPALRDGDWGSWSGAFKRAGRAYGRWFRRELRARLVSKMPELHRALDTCQWRGERAWGRAARTIGPVLRPYALLAEEFCTWADEVRQVFQTLIESPPSKPAPRLPRAMARARIPADLKRWKPLREVLEGWRPAASERTLAALHRKVFEERGYGNELWLRWEDGRRSVWPGRASGVRASEGSDCRWANAVELMRPER